MLKDVKKIKVFPMRDLRRYKNAKGCAIYYDKQNDAIFRAVSNQVRHVFESIDDSEKFDKSDMLYAYTLVKHADDMTIFDLRIAIVKDRQLVEISDLKASNTNYGCFQVVMVKENNNDIEHRGFVFIKNINTSFKECNNKEEI